MGASLALYSIAWSQQRSSKFLLLLIGYAIIFTVGTQWNPADGMVHLFSVPTGGIGEERIYVMQDAFCDHVALVYIPILVFFLRSDILMPIASSHTVSNMLWVRLSSISSVSMQIYRILIALGGCALIFGIMAAWTFAFALWHVIPIKLLLLPALSPIAYILFTSGIVILIKGSPLLSTEFRAAYVWSIILLPYAMYLFRSVGVKAVGAIFPFAAPYLRDTLGIQILHGTVSAGIIGCALLATSFLTSDFLNSPTHFEKVHI